VSEAAKRFLAAILLFLAAGMLVGWLYGSAWGGLLVAALLALAWQIRQLLAFERALRTGDFSSFRYGEGIWEQLFSRFRFEHQRATRRKKSYRNLLKEIRKSTDAMPDAAIVLNAANEILTCNRASRDLAGLRRKKDRGQRIDNILRDPDFVRLLHSGDFTETVDIASPVRDGDWLNCRIVPYGADQKLVLLRDVTERIRLTKMRRDFVANASHELRSPLTVISGYVDSLADDPEKPAHWARPLEQMQSQAERMRELLDDLLELSRLEHSGKAAATDLVGVAELMERSKRAFEGLADTADISVRADVTIGLLGDAGEIETVIVNLLSNAVRHTPPEGSIVMTWEATPDGAELSVRDTGDGVAEEYIPRLTERFFRVDRGRSRDGGGTGLGLAIVKHVLARHDAELIITSTLGRGSEFRCHFPQTRVDAVAR